LALDPNRWTLKTQEALNQAIESARSNANPEVTPDHLLAALLGQEEGVVLPILTKVGKAPFAVRNEAQAAVDRLPKAYGSDARMSRELTTLLDAADEARRELHD
jgi:ATP-dependent Clp protease ATP-binding subunit ClpB